MAHEKVEKNIYYDDRCTKMPYFVNVTRNGQQFYKKFNDFDQAVEARDQFIERHTMMETDNPFVFVKNGVFVLEAVVYKEFDNYEDAVKNANIIQRFTG